ncbi:mycofactocin biosynthesis glycosyltransferase MftF [Cryptosporangium aurantiacum]|uniref:Mycofactocin system glycosyltransferase n=1 Tax=Cryptosporangium aurantiacum TaxID=134849 RepID=A0A1M7RPX5_9ACTN|nr:mycofactocin biosynthesis glycosyltransferase MftF [Cryptosporangium aurantiacum]SHN48146.1 mycofactocin system glycosyltransferase [Cryptosporangium aurantiacum]
MTAVGAAERGLAPAGLRLRLDAALRISPDGRTLLGGSPGRLLRVAAAGADLIRAWDAGTPIGTGTAQRKLARRLLDAGMAHPLRDPVDRVADVTIVVPTFERTAELTRCLTALRRTAPDAPIVVVDDGSPATAGIPDVAARFTARLVRHPERRGPSAARNTGLAAVTTPFAALVDSDVVVPDGWLHALRPYFDDAAVAAVAPRVLGHGEGHGWLGEYEAAHSPLDMGPSPGLVRPGALVPYVPTATLLVRMEAVREIGGRFDVDLPIGEDVDFEWRLVDAGWNVHYVPAVTIGHDHRTRLRPFVARRRLYARSIGLLERRHPGALPAARVSPALAAACVLLAARRPVAVAAAGVAAAVGVGLVARQLKPVVPEPVAEAARLVRNGLPVTAMGLARAVGRVWWPVLVPVAVAAPRWRAPLAVAVAAPVLADWWSGGRRPRLDRYLAARVLDDVVSTAGTWEGSLRAGTLGPLLPAGTRR